MEGADVLATTGWLLAALVQLEVRSTWQEWHQTTLVSNDGDWTRCELTQRLQEDSPRMGLRHVATFVFQQDMCCQCKNCTTLSTFPAFVEAKGQFPKLAGLLLVLALAEKKC